MPFGKSVQFSTGNAGPSQSQPTGPPTGPNSLTRPTPPRYSQILQGQTANTYRTTALTNARNIGQARTTVPQASAQQVPPSIAGPATPQTTAPTNPNVWNPSQGPTPSMVTINWKAQANQSNASYNTLAPVNSGVCKRSHFTRYDFQKGDVISLPYHQANNNPRVNPAQDPKWTMTVVGPCYSKRRMMIVMWKYDQDMFCIPLYSFEGRGLQGKPHLPKKEYVCVKNSTDTTFYNQGNYQPIVATMKQKPLDANTTVWMTGGMRVACNDDIAKIGRVERLSYNQLLSLWNQLTDAAKKEAS